MTISKKRPRYLGYSPPAPNAQPCPSPLCHNRSAHSAPHAHATGTMSRTIADFDVIRELGDGAFSRVWLVSEKKTGGVYAMKVQEKKHLLRKRSVGRAILERDILTRLNHHFVVKLIYAFQTKVKLCLVLEHIDGGTLGELQEMMPGHLFRERAVRFAASEILVALDYIHSLGIIYRDLKPENICE